MFQLREGDEPALPKLQTNSSLCEFGSCSGGAAVSRLAPHSSKRRDHRRRYDCSIDVRELVSVEDVMAEMNLGPNGGLVYAMEYLVENIDWLQASVAI